MVDSAGGAAPAPAAAAPSGPVGAGAGGAGALSREEVAELRRLLADLEKQNSELQVGRPAGSVHMLLL